QSGVPWGLKQSVGRWTDYETKQIGSNVVAGKVVNGPLANRHVKIVVGNQYDFLSASLSGEHFATWCDNAAATQIGLVTEPGAIGFVTCYALDHGFRDCPGCIEHVTASLIGDCSRCRQDDVAHTWLDGREVIGPKRRVGHSVL